MPFNHLLLYRPLLLLPSIFPSIRVFSNDSILCSRWPKYWSFSFSISFSNEYSGLISFRMDWFDLFAVQGNLKSLLQHHSPKASTLQCSALFIVQLLHPYMTTGKATALIQSSSVTQSGSSLCHPMDCSMPGLPVHHQLPGLTQTDVHWVGDAIQPSHPPSYPSPPAFSLSQY